MGRFAPPPTTALSPGDRLDRYELLCVLAQGGMGTVWLARMTGKHGFERLVALKTILASYGGDRQFSDMFLDEARIAAQIDHENVARILEIGEDRGVLYHAMELIDGESLRKLYRDIKTAGAPFPIAVALRICADLCAGLHAVHELHGQDGLSLDVVHRDVSPQNVLINIRGTVKLIDFGVAKARQRRTEETTAGTLKGKLEYMAPEQARGEAIDRRADVYAVGAVLYELLAGDPVRSTEDGRQLLALHELMTGAPYEPLPPSIPLPVRTLVDRALTRDPQARFRTAEDMRHALEQAMITIGQMATTDDVANVLAHFSRDRTARRKEAIDAAVRAAPPSIQNHRPSVHTVIAPQVPSSSPQPPSDMYRGPKGTQVLGMHVSPGEGPGTGASMRTMQGAALSGPPPPAGNNASRIFAGVVVVGFVTMLGIVIGVLVARGGAPAPSIQAAAAGQSSPRASNTGVESVGVAPTDLPTIVTPTPPTATTAMGSGDPGMPGVILGASDGGAPPVLALPTASSTPAPTGVGNPGKTVVPSTKRNRGRAGGQKSDPGDEYGF